MPIFDQGYQHYNGPIISRLWRWLAITRRGVMPLLGVWYIRILLFACVICPIILVIVLTIWGMVESGAEYVKPFLQMLQISDDMVAQYRELRVTVWTLFFNIFFNTQIPLALFVLVMVGPSLISQDLRFNAIPLYLSRPITRFEYFLGKFGVIAIFMTLALLVPVVAAYVFGVLFSLSFDVVRTTWPLLVGSIIYSLIVTLSASTLMLAMSALSKNSLRVATMWILFLVISHSTASVIEGIYRDPSAGAISYRENLHRVQQACLGVIDASNSFVKFQENMAMQTQRASLGPLANIFGMRQPPRTTNKGGANPGKTGDKQKAPDVKQGSKSSDGGKSAPSQGSKSSPTTNKTGNGPPIPPVPPNGGFGPRGGPQRGMMANGMIPNKDLSEPFPLWWSGAILGGLFVVSVLILSSRIRSLDRLK